MVRSIGLAVSAIRCLPLRSDDEVLLRILDFLKALCLPHSRHRYAPLTTPNNARRTDSCHDPLCWVGVSAATVSRVLRLRLNSLKAPEPAEPVRRYERANPGELIHIDIKKLGRIGSVGHRIPGRRSGVVNRHLGIGWEFVHVCIDDASRIAFQQVMNDERKNQRHRFPRGGGSLLRKPRREGRASHD